MAVRDSSHVGGSPVAGGHKKPSCTRQMYVYPSNPSDIVQRSKEYHTPNDSLHTPTLSTPSIPSPDLVTPTQSLTSSTNSGTKIKSWSAQVGLKFASLWPVSKSGSVVISEQDVGPGLDLARDSLPDWRFWENRLERWLGFPPADAVEIERYWAYFISNEHLGEGAKRIAKLEVAKKKAVIHFEDMMVQFGGGALRPLVRRHLPDDWLSNANYLLAFSGFLGDRVDDLGGKVENLFDMHRNEDFRHMELTVALHSTFPSVDIVARGRAFKPPIKWKRFAASVSGKVSDAPEWYKKRDPGSWGVAYIGLNKESLPQVLFTAFAGRAGSQKGAEVDILATPRLAVAEEDARTDWWEGRAFQLILELRVRPSEMQGETAANPYWVLKSARDVRVNAVLMRGL